MCLPLCLFPRSLFIRCPGVCSFAVFLLHQLSFPSRHSGPLGFLLLQLLSFSCLYSLHVCVCVGVYMCVYMCVCGGGGGGGEKISNCFCGRNRLFFLLCITHVHSFVNPLWHTINTLFCTLKVFYLHTICTLPVHYMYSSAH